MVLEILLFRFEGAFGPTTRPVFRDVCIHNPIFFRRDRAKPFRILLDEEEDGVRLRIVAGGEQKDSHLYSSCLLEGDGAKLEGLPPGSNFKGPPSPASFGGCHPVFLGEASYGSFLPHGPHFQCRLDPVEETETRVMGWLAGYTSTLAFSTEAGPDLPLLNPGLIDGLLQACAMIAIRHHNRFILPVGASVLRADARSLSGDGPVYVSIEMEGRYSFRMEVWDRQGDGILVAEDMTFNEMAARPGRGE
jgi:hypothetical protein